MTLPLFAVPLLGNMPPPSIRVTLPQGREWVYQFALWAFAALAVVAIGLWCVQRKTLSPKTGRVLLWLVAGCVGIAYTTGWLWFHRDSGIVPPGTPVTLAATMHAFWGLGAVTVVVVGWRRVHGNPKQRLSASVGRALLFAFLTLTIGVALLALGCQPALIVLVPTIILDKIFGLNDDGLIVLGGSMAFWWAVWCFVLLKRSKSQAETIPEPPTSPEETKSSRVE